VFGSILTSIAATLLPSAIGAKEQFENVQKFLVQPPEDGG
jgi:hypothetical protein